jgi:hypothetical protein
MNILISMLSGALTILLAAGITGSAAWLLWSAFKLTGYPGCGPLLVPLLVVLVYDLELRELFFAQALLGTSCVIAYFMLEEGDRWRKERAEKRQKRSQNAD